MTNLLRFDFNDRDGIFEVVENGDWVRATDYDALAAKLAEAERVARYESDIAQQALDQMRAAEAALPAVYRLATKAHAKWLRKQAGEKGGTKTPQGRTAQFYARKLGEQPTPTAAELMARIQTGENK